MDEQDLKSKLEALKCIEATMKFTLDNYETNVERFHSMISAP